MNACGSVAEILPHHEAILALLQAIAPGPATDTAAAYIGAYGEGEIPDKPPLDTDRRVLPYYVLHPTPGEHIGRTVAGYSGAFLYSFGVTVVGGDLSRCLWAVDRLNAALVGSRLTVPGRQSGLIHPGPATGALSRADAHSPNRHVAALRFDVATA